MKVLVIDDNVSITEMLSKFLTLKGFDCKVVNNGKEGLSELLSQQFDSVLLDLSMPEFSGYDVLEELKKENKIKNQKIIVLTALPIGEEKTNLLLETGVTAVMKKPPTLQELLKVLS